MKNLFRYLVASVLGISTIISCSVEERTFDDASQVYLSSNNLTRTVSSTVASSDVDIPYSLTSAAEGTHTVNLVFDPNFSAAVPGVDFQILAGDEVTAGEVGGVLKLRIFSTPASPDGKIANFKISSPTLSNFKDKQLSRVLIVKTCPLNTFLGSFTNTAGWFNPGQVVNVVEDTATPNKLLVKNFFGSGKDLPLTYDPSSYVVTVPTMQTGTIDAQYGMISIRPSTDATKISSFNSCTRVVRLYVNYFVAAGTFGNFEERLNGN